MCGIKFKEIAWWKIEWQLFLKLFTYKATFGKLWWHAHCTKTYFHQFRWLKSRYNKRTTTQLKYFTTLQNYRTNFTRGFFSKVFKCFKNRYRKLCLYIRPFNNAFYTCLFVNRNKLFSPFQKCWPKVLTF